MAEYSYDKEDLSEEEELDALIEAVGDLIREDELKTAVIVPKKYEDIKRTYAMLEYIIKGKDASLDYVFNQPFKSMGVISVEAKELIFDNPELFSKVSELADSVDVYPLTSGKLRMEFTFHGLTRPIE